MKPVTRIDEGWEAEPELRAALEHFRQNVDAWSEAVAARPRTVTPAARMLHWRLALGTALGCLLTAASVTALITHRHGAEQARQTVVHRPAASVEPVAAQTPAMKDEQAEAAARDQIDVENLLASQESQDEQSAGQVSNDEQLLAAVDTDLKQQIPRVMEPLAQLGEDSAAQ